MELKTVAFIFFGLLSVTHVCAQSDVSASLSVKNDGSSLTIRRGEIDVATYTYKHEKVLRPFFAHATSPKGKVLTRSFPPVEGKDPTDHDTMHPGIWLAFGDLGGEDFWRNKGRVIHERFVEQPTVEDSVVRFTERKSYRRVDGTIVCREEFVCSLRELPAGFLITWDSTFSSAGSNFYFGDQEEMGLGVRVATAVTETNGGRISDSEDRTTAKRIWSQASDWCDYRGRSGGNEIGVTILCHPKNLRASWMHARNYGLLVANMFGRKAMNKGEASKIVVREGSSLRLRYGVLLHDATPNLADVHRTYVKLADR